MRTRGWRFGSSAGRTPRASSPAPSASKSRLATLAPLPLLPKMSAGLSVVTKEMPVAKPRLPLGIRVADTREPATGRSSCTVVRPIPSESDVMRTRGFSHLRTTPSSACEYPLLCCGYRTNAIYGMNEGLRGKNDRDTARSTKPTKRGKISERTIRLTPRRSGNRDWYHSPQ